ncbi:MAG: OPT/YSL family transporter, partial [Ignavibacteriaceae bacterium]|nr:OPT/YSL family transporter [Ignavibacteriaceae bacterium]
PTIVSAFKDSIGDFKAGSAGKSTLRTEKDLPLVFVLVGAVVLVAFMAIIPSIPTNLLSAIMIVVFGFFFVTVSSRIVGIIGSSSNPISGMTIATLMATSLIFVGLGWTGSAHQPIALVVGSIVCIAAANAGATSQDLKTGYIVGATPIKQQYGLIIGVVASSVVIGATMLILNNAIGIGADSTVSANPLPAPQATLMATVIKGLLSQDLPWGLVVTGMGISAVLELAGVRSLPFAVGAYLPLSTTAPIFLGGLVKWFVEKKNSSKEDDGEIGPGALFSSGLIAGGSLTGILLAVLIATEVEAGKNVIDVLHVGLVEGLGGAGDLISLGVFVLLGYGLYKVATKTQK